MSDTSVRLTVPSTTNMNLIKTYNEANALEVHRKKGKFLFHITVSYSNLFLYIDNKVSIPLNITWRQS